MEFEVYGMGLCYASVCTSLPVEEAVKRINDTCPTGISSNWKLADEKFAGGAENGCDCPDHAGNKHYLMNC